VSDKLYALTADPGKPLREAREEIARLRAERDDARRKFCTATVSRPFGSGTIYNCGAAEEEATRRGWDCFKEDGK
jgi:hypothetical protein